MDADGTGRAAGGSRVGVPASRPCPPPPWLMESSDLRRHLGGPPGTPRAAGRLKWSQQPGSRPLEELRLHLTVCADDVTQDVGCPSPKCRLCA